MESALGSYPGMFPTAPPAEGTPYGVYWPTTVALGQVVQRVHLDTDGTVREVAVVPAGAVLPAGRLPGTGAEPVDRRVGEQTRRVPLGGFLGARSGDKGGDANVGIWVRGTEDDVLDEERAQWLRWFVTPDRIRALLPEAAKLAIDVHRLDNLRAVNVVVHGLLGRGVADSTSLDPQAKGLGEQLRARYAEIPVSLLREGGDA